MALHVGARLPDRPAAPITRQGLLDVMKVMDDINPIHHDDDLARRLGFRGVVNQGPCNIAYITDMLSAWAGSSHCVRRLSLRFLDTVTLGDEVIAGGEIVEVLEEQVVRCNVWLHRADGVTVVDGSAWVFTGPGGAA